MSALRRHGRLLVIAVPVVLLLAALAGLLPGASDNASKAQNGSAALNGPAGNPAATPAATAGSQADPAALGLPTADGRGGASAPETSLQPVLGVYRCLPGTVDTAAARLEEQYRGNANVRVVPDRRTSQLLVMAPPEVQAQIAKTLLAVSGQDRMNAVTPSEASRAPRTPPAVPGAGAAEEVQLLHATGDEFEVALVRMLADRLTPVASSKPDTSAYRLALGGGRELQVTVDRRASRVRLEGTGTAIPSALQLVYVLDRADESPEQSAQLVSVRTARQGDVARLIDALQTGYSAEGGAAGESAVATRPNPVRVAMALQPSDQPGSPPAQPPVPEAGPAAAAVQTPAVPGRAAPGAEALGGAAAELIAGEGGLIGQVQIEPIPGTDLLIIRGREQDVQRVRQLITRLEELAKEAEPVIRVYHLSHVDCRSLGTLLTTLYQAVYSTRQGTVSITALVKPNALLLIGRQESVETVVTLIQKLDRPVPPGAQFRVFRLKNTGAEQAQEALTTFFAPEAGQQQVTGLAPRVLIIADFRTNSLIVRANPNDMTEVAAVIEKMDAPENESLNQVRIFKLKNSLAEDLAPVLQDAITAQMYGQRTGQRFVMQRALGAQEQFERKSIRLQFVTTDEAGQRTLNSGILTDVLVTADARANALIVTASPDSMPLIAALIEELDRLPTAEAQVKVFTVVHGDATSLVQTLQSLFGTQAQAGAVAVRTGASGEDSSLVTLRFSVDIRSNSIIATGSAGDLDVVEAILLRLDESDLRARQTVVMRLKNASAETVADAVTDFLSDELQAEQPVQGLLSSVERTEREVVVVPETVTNSLIISATERFFDRVVDLVEKLDSRPPMVLIQVLIAAVSLNDTEEFGVELGLQDSILFNRSVANVPGFLFNSTSPLGNNTSAANPQIVGTQGISNLALGRGNPSLGYGGLVFSASSEAVSVLIRALKDQRRVDILGRPQIMTVDRVMGTIHVGQNVPYITSVSPATNLASQTFSVDFVDVGIQLQVTPVVNPDGLVVMNVTAIRSEVGPESEGIPISVAADGTVIRSPRIDIAETNSTVSAMSGQTVVLGGLITKDTSQVTHRVPWLSDVPVLGRLFRYDSTSIEKSELLFILTPHVVDSDEELERMKRLETARINWVLTDVLEVHGDPFASPEGGTVVIYPDAQPNIEKIEPRGHMPQLPEAPGEEGAQTPFMVEPPPPDPAPNSSSAAQPAPQGSPGSAMESASGSRAAALAAEGLPEARLASASATPPRAAGLSRLVPAPRRGEERAGRSSLVSTLPRGSEPAGRLGTPDAVANPPQ